MFYPSRWKEITVDQSKVLRSRLFRYFWATRYMTWPSVLYRFQATVFLSCWEKQIVSWCQIRRIWRMINQSRTWAIATTDLCAGAISYPEWVYLEVNNAVRIRKGWIQCMPDLIAVSQLLLSQPMNFSAHPRICIYCRWYLNSFMIWNDSFFFSFFFLRYLGLLQEWR